MEISKTKDNFIAFIKKLGSEEFQKIRKICYLVFSVLPIISIIALFFSPVCKVILRTGEEYKVTANQCFSSISSEDTVIKSFALVELALFVVVLAILLLNVFMIIKILLSYSKEKVVSKATKVTIVVDLVTTAFFTVFAFLFSPINVLLGGRSFVSVNLFPLVFTAVITVAFACFSGLVSASTEKIEDKVIFDKKALEGITKKRRALTLAKVELFVYAFVCSCVSIISLLSNIITVTFEFVFSPEPTTITLKGWDLLFPAEEITEVGRQGLSYIIFMLFLLLVTTLFLTIVSFASRSDLFTKLSIVTIAFSSAVCLAIALIGKYYDIVQNVNEGLVYELVNSFIPSPDLSSYYQYEVVSNSIYWFFISLGVVSILFFRRTYTRTEKTARELAEEETARLPQVIEISNTQELADGIESSHEDHSMAIGTDTTQQNLDPCPSFTALDRKRAEYANSLEERKKLLFENPTLPKLVDFIVQYARDSRLHLFYTPESIAEFLAGLGTTRLSILQGMSGTGKTSLPKIVSEALCSVCDIVEVESSWRDKNELLGYYNEFSKTYTPKKFTEALYRAKLNPEVLTFIVLDEMNLSRIEYYFSDFLSLMENEPDKRTLKLLNTPLFRRNNGKIFKYVGIDDGHTIKIPENVWFIGTANRDESTYDISDKVYDRAHTMNFDKRAAKVQYYNEAVPQRYIPAPVILELFENAKKSLDFHIEQYPVIAEVEKLLAPYNISFGNRIAMQIESFVKIYTACFSANESVIRDALEIILLSKVVRKLELKNLEDKETLAEEFAKLQLKRCHDFIMSIKED